MRTYERLWNKLKSLPRKEAEKVGVSVTVPKALHRRTVKAVKKEKWMDVGYKIEIEPREAVLSHSISNLTITFRLSFSLTIEDI